MHVLAPAKINLYLRVSPRESSGFHPLVSWLCTAALFDSLTIDRSEESGVRLACDDADLPRDEKNLVMRAAAALQRDDLGATVTLAKRIPVAAGLGGGSSDAARTLLGLNQLWNLQLPLARLQEIAARLGSDVPFFLHGSSSICSGYGQIVRPAPRPTVTTALLMFPGFGLSTADVYRTFDLEGTIRHEGSGEKSEPPWQEWAKLSAGPLLSRLVNDLEPAAFTLAPRLKELHDALEESLRRVIRMSGSGSTLFTLYDERDEAESAAQVVQAQYSLRVAVVELAPRVVDDISMRTHINNS